jgi:hypothetical protein
LLNNAILINLHNKYCIIELKIALDAQNNLFNFDEYMSRNVRYSHLTFHNLFTGVDLELIIKNIENEQSRNINHLFGFN